MNTQDKIKITIGMVFIALFAVFVGSEIGRAEGRNEIQQQAIERGLAILYPHTGDFIWTKEGK